MSTTLHTRLLALFLLFLGAGWVLLGLYTQKEAADIAAAEIDARLLRAATNLLAGWHESRQLFAAGPKRGPDPEPPESVDALDIPRPTGLAEFELSTLDREVLARSHDFPVTSARPANAPEGYSTQRIDGRRWRVLTLINPHSGLVVRVGLPMTERQRLSELLTVRFVNPLLFAFPVFALLAWLSLWYGLRPLRRVTRELERREATDLAPLSAAAERGPVDVRTLVHTLNRLFTRVQDILTTQRAFTSAAGHELRNPLAGMYTQLQVARRAGPGAQREQALAQLEQATGHLQRLVNHLLLLARLDPAARRIRTAPLDLGDLVEHTVAGHRGDDTGPRICVTMAPALPAVDGDPDLLGAMLGNLLDNALEQEPAEGEVVLSVVTSDGDGWLELTVRDHGPGITEAERGRLFESFYSAGARGNPGSGLGLAVVRHVVDAHGGEVHLANAAAGGARVTVRLPPAPR